MAISRSVTTRLVEGLARNFRLDADLVARFGSRIYKGPLLGENPSPFDPPQMHINAATDPYSPGVAGASNVERTIIVTIFDPYDLQFPSEGSPNVWGPDYVEHVAKLVMAGGDGTTATDDGRIKDPDNPSGISLNTEVIRMTPEPFYESVKDVAIVHRLVITFGTRLNQAFARV